MSTFSGRWRYNWAVLSPLGLRFGDSAVAEANATLAARAAGQPRSDSDCWHATGVLATAAPAGELLPMPLRGCGWALCNTPTIAFMVSSALHHPTCTRRIVFGQWLNQTHLAGVTWCNRGASAEGDGPSTAVVAASYIGALVTAIPIAVGGGKLSQRSPLLKPFARFAPYPAVALANFLGSACMRSSDATRGALTAARRSVDSSCLIDHFLDRFLDARRASQLARPRFPRASRPREAPSVGVPVADPADGQPLGLSRAAGERAVRDTCVTRRPQLPARLRLSTSASGEVSMCGSRLLMPVGNFLIVPAVVWLYTAARRIRQPSLATQVAVTAAVFSVWLPTAASFYPPVGSLALDEIEPHLRSEAEARARRAGRVVSPSVEYERGV